ncbi:MAG: right-handed parallel beta-helix repeat-containing protein [Oscillospiraceae bacterium]|jgi:polygalacturonase|nr:right-handed parallel beta-helix repeat-containing protein [Oscillospiraceae bacterium]
MKHKKLRLALLCALALAALGGGIWGGIYLWQIQPQPIAPGDYNEHIPFADYIEEQEIPQGKNVFNVRDYAVDGQKDWTQAIRAAIAAVRENSGGTLLFEGGDFVSGTVDFSNTIYFTLWVAPNARLIASHKFGDFDGAFIKATGAEHVRITGGGIIDGQGEYFVKRPKELPRLTPYDTTDIRALRDDYYDRIRFGRLGRPSAMVWLRDCSDVQVDNITLCDSMHWTLKIDLSDNVLVENMVIDNNRHVANTDGIDIVGSQDVTVRHCFISTADDGIVLKTPEEKNPEPVWRVNISDCEIQTCVNAFKIGTETIGEISTVSLNNIHAALPGIYPGGVSGISIESEDGAYVHDVTIRNFSMDGVTCPLFIRLGDRNRYGGQKGAGRLENITVENLTARDAELPMLISGVKNGKSATQYIKNVTLRDFDITYRDNNEQVELRDDVPEYAKDYPENWRFLDVPAFGLWARHVDGLTLEGIGVTPRTVNTRGKFAWVDVLHFEEEAQ